MSFILIFILSIIFLFFLSLIAYLYLLVTFNYNRKERNFASKHILIFGASQGLGEALSFRLSKQRVHLSIAARTESKLKMTQEKCISINKNITCDYYIVDITNESDIKNCLEDCIKKNGFPNLIINCAGIAHPGFLEEIPLEIYYKDMELNYFGNLKLLKKISELHKKNNINEKIDIVCVGSILGIIGSIGYSTYAPSKYALKGLLDSLRFEFIGKKINLHYYAPSNMETPGLEIENKNKPQIVKDMENNAKTISADEAALILLSNLDKYLITTETDLELLKLCPGFMNENRLFDFLLLPIAGLGIMFSRMGIENNILSKIKGEKIY